MSLITAKAMMRRAVMREKSCKYHLPIIVDKEGVIVLGHERYFALTELGKEIPVAAYNIPDDQALKYRMVDCRISQQNPSSRLKLFYNEIKEHYVLFKPGRKDDKPKDKPRSKGNKRG